MVTKINDIAKDRILGYLMGLSEETKILHADSLEFVERKKGSYLLRPGQFCEHLYFIINGACRIYFKKGNREVTSQLLFESDVVVSYYSFLTKTRTTETIQLLEDTQFFRISYDDIYNLYEVSEEINTLGRILNENYLLKVAKRIEILQTLSARERYVELLENSPEVIQRVPSFYLASYLGITPETLSRVRASITTSA